jgi:phosphatidylglycerophosphate synthase
MLYRQPLWGVPVYQLGLILAVIAAMLTLVSMVRYLQAAWPTLRDAN